MAQYWKTTKHEDTVEKRPLTSDDIEFLLKMQKELNTQDCLSQAHPRYWTIRDYNRIYGSDLNSTDGICLYDVDACDNIYEGDNLYVDDSTTELIFNILENHVKSKAELKLALEHCCYLTEVVEELTDSTITVYEYEEYAFDVGMFLTHEAAINHLKANEHNYSDKAHTYAHTAIRTEEKHLWDLLSEIDWNLYATKDK